MKPIYQTKFGFRNGNCMQAVVASLLELSLEEVPEFRGKDDSYSWWDEYLDFMKSQGYEFDEMIGNCKQLGAYGDDRLKLIVEGKIESIEGFYYATVYSPGLFDRIQYICNPKYEAPYHAVIIDKDFNIVHDPHSHYTGVKQYPLHERIGYNGVISVDVFKKKVECNIITAIDISGSGFLNEVEEL